MNRLPFGKWHMVQPQLAIPFNDSFRMECLHNEKNLTHIMLSDKRGKGGFGQLGFDAETQFKMARLK